MNQLYINAYTLDCEENGIELIDSLISENINKTLTLLKNCNFIDNETNVEFKHMKNIYERLTYKLNYYKEIVDENRDTLIETCIQDIQNTDKLPHYYYDNLREEMKNNDYMLLHRMIKIDCQPDNMFGLNNSCYYENTHKLYYNLCMNYEKKLLDNANERFNEQFKSVGERIEALNLLVAKPNMIEIMRLICK